ncbi:MAG: hypothetical protein M3322_04410 [Actinomycetota bacterium]|nr:hypothetical protein [Actinomycetota bacterium]
MSPGDVLREAWHLYKAHWQHFIPLAAIYFLVLSLVTLVLQLLFDEVGAVASAFVSLVGIFWLQGALVEAIADVRDHRVDLTIGETFAKARPHVLRLLGAGLLAALAITIGLVLLVVPGLILLTWWSLIIPVIVLEGVRVADAFGRSRELVRGNGWNVFAVIVLTWLVVIAASILIGIFFVWLPVDVRGYVSNVVTNSLLVPYVAIAWTLMYYRLARRDIGIEPVPATP